MFTADGKKLLKEKETGTPEEQLRSLASIKLQQEIKVEQDKIARCNELLEKLLAGNANLSALKTCQNILKLLKAYSDKFKELQVRTPNFTSPCNWVNIGKSRCSGGGSASYHAQSAQRCQSVGHQRARPGSASPDTHYAA
jgi:hypothetical protein